WSAEDEGFIAIASDLPGCSAFGESQEEALAELQHAIAAWIEAAQSAGNPIPQPSELARQAEYSGKVLVRMPRELHGQLSRSAKPENVSWTPYIVYLPTGAAPRHSIQASTQVIRSESFGLTMYRTTLVTGGSLTLGNPSQVAIGGTGGTRAVEMGELGSGVT